MRKKLISLILLPLIMIGCGSAPAKNAAGSTMPVGADAAPAENAQAGGIYSWNDGSFGSSTEAADPGEVAMTTEEPMHWFVLDRSNHTSTAEDGTVVLYEYRCDADFTATDDSLEQWVDGILEEIDREYTTRSANLHSYALEDLKIMGLDTFYGYSNYQDIGVARHDDKVVSLLVLNSVYSGGMHPNSLQTALNLDMETQTILTLEDILLPGGEKVLAELVYEHIGEKFSPLGDGALFDDYAETIASSFVPGTMTPYWYFNSEGIVVFFNQYALGPYAAGIITAEMLYEELTGVLRDEFLPKVHDDGHGDLLLRGGWEGYRQYTIKVERGGSEIMIGVEGEVTQVRLSEVSWIDQTAIGQKVLFSANRMTQSDVLILVGGFDDPQRSFAVEFRNASGEPGLYYVHSDELTTKP